MHNIKVVAQDRITFLPAPRGKSNASRLSAPRVIAFGEVPQLVYWQTLVTLQSLTDSKVPRTGTFVAANFEEGNLPNDGALKISWSPAEPDTSAARSCRLLLSKGHRVTVFDNLCHSRRGALPPEAATFIQGDLADRILLEQTLTAGAFDGILHFAALIEAGESDEGTLRSTSATTPSEP